ncbi:hypothetical protein PFZ49_12790 [Microbacterium lacticum]|uniref:hypothetical protein n=1 Tax=Microbacterium lacticum TaxID=33885 RepID=UPI003A87D52A
MHALQHLAELGAAMRSPLFARLLLQGCARRTGFSVAASTILTDAIPEVQSGAQGSRAQPARPFYPWLTFDYG